MDQFTPMNPLSASDRVPPPQPEHSNTGAFVGAIIVIILLAVGGLYFWGAKLNETPSNPPPLILGNDTPTSTSETPTSDASAGLPPQSDSDAASAISADLQAMDLNRLDAQTASSMEAFGAGAQ